MSKRVRNKPGWREILVLPFGGNRGYAVQVFEHLDELRNTYDYVVFDPAWNGEAEPATHQFDTVVEAFDHAFKVAAWNARVEQRFT